MSQYSVSLEVGPDHAVPAGPPVGKSAVVNVASGEPTVYYGDNPQVTPTSNQGSIAGGAAASFATAVWLKAAAVSSVRIDYQDAQTISVGAGLSALEANGAYPSRSTVTSDLTKTVVWIGIDPPTIGSGYANNVTDIWIPTSV